jgi:hypothetical protein
MDMSKPYYCYSEPQKKFIESKGVKNVGEGTHPKTKKQYWEFNRSDELDKTLNQWRENKRKAIDLIRQLNQ